VSGAVSSNSHLGRSELTYVYSYANPGPTDLLDVRFMTLTPAHTTFERALPSPAISPPIGGSGSIVLDVGELPQGGSGRAIVTVRVDPDTPPGTQIDNTPFALDAAEPPLVVFGDRTPVEVPEMLRLAMDKQVAADPTRPEQPLTYVVTYSNTSRMTVGDLVIEEDYGEDVQFLEAEPQPDPGNDGRWSLGDLEPGATGRISITVVPGARADGTIVRTATTASSADELVASATADFVVESAPGLELRIDAATAAFRGGRLRYRVRYSNTGPVDVADVVLEMGYDPRLLFRSANPHPDEGTTTSWTLGTIAAGARGTIVIDSAVSVSAENGALLQSVTVLQGGGRSAVARATTVVAHR
jgi:Domain of unknown function DUF11